MGRARVFVGIAVVSLGLLAAGCDCGGYDTHLGRDGGTPVDPCPEGDCECEPGEVREGCPCDALEPVPCYSGPAGTAGVGECGSGLRTCTDGLWDSCVGERLPSEDICDDLDNDCDGQADDGVRNACGDCNPDCREISFGREDGQIPFAPDDGNSAGVEERDDGALVLEGDSFRLHVVWIANSPESTISKIDTETLEEVGRYRTGPAPTLHDPSRTSLDYRGNAYVLNRALFWTTTNQPSVTRIQERDCPDLDGDFEQDTSRGREDVREWGDDECVVWRTEVGNPNGVGRAVAVNTRLEGGAPEDYVWVGLYAERRYVELEAESGELTGREVSVAPCTPYGAAIDRDGNLWSGCTSTYLARFDTNDTDDVEVITNPVSNYGITVDEEGMVWLGGSCGRYDPSEDVFTRIAGCQGAGIAADGHGSVWVGGCGGGTCRIDADTLEVSITPAESRGVAVDFSGQIWGIPMTGYVDLIDPGDEPGDEIVDRILDDCEGGPCLNRPYTYSDMSGFQLVNATNPEGFWETVVEGCGGGETSWVRLSWDAETPEGTSVTFQVRAAETIADLEVRPWSTVAVAPRDASSVELAAALGRDAGVHLLGVRALLATSRHGGTPVLNSVSVQRSCPFRFE